MNDIGKKVGMRKDIRIKKRMYCMVENRIGCMATG